VKTNAKFDRRVNIRTRSSNAKLFWLAFAATAAANLLFFSLFTGRDKKERAESGSALTMLGSSDFRADQREGFRNWIEYHDPRGSIRGDIDDAVVGEILRDVRPAGLKSELGGDIPLRAPAVGDFSEVPGRGVPARTLPPAPPREKAASVAAAAVTDGEGNELPVGDMKLPPRTPRTTGRTVLRVFNGGNTPALLLEKSCGDAELDGFAMRSLAFLAGRGSTPEFMIVEWPEAEK